jgi:hypothetical protein
MTMKPLHIPVPAIETLEKMARAMEIPMYQFFYDGEIPPKPAIKWDEKEGFGSLPAEARTLGVSDVCYPGLVHGIRRFCSPSQRKWLDAIRRLVSGHDLAQVLISRVVSRGRCNTGLQFIRRSFESQCFSGPLIQAHSDFVQVRLREAGPISRLRQVLPQKPVGVFVRAALPGALRIAEVNLYIGSHGEAFVLAISSPRSQVSERRNVAGSWRTCWLSAATTVAVSLPGTFTSMQKRE